MCSVFDIAHKHFYTTHLIYRYDLQIDFNVYCSKAENCQRPFCLFVFVLIRKSFLMFKFKAHFINYFAVNHHHFVVSLSISPIGLRLIFRQYFVHIFHRLKPYNNVKNQCVFRSSNFGSSYASISWKFFVLLQKRSEPEAF